MGGALRSGLPLPRLPDRLAHARSLVRDPGRHEEEVGEAVQVREDLAAQRLAAGGGGGGARGAAAPPPRAGGGGGGRGGGAPRAPGGGGGAGGGAAAGGGGGGGGAWRALAPGGVASSAP